MATEKHTASRRSFLATVGVGAAALAVPAGVVAAGTGGPTFAAGTWRAAVAAWPSAAEAMKAQTEAILAQLRPAYLAEIGRLAEENRGRFAPGGDLYPALGDPDTIAGEDEEHAACDRIEALCSERFGLEVEQHGYEEPEGDAVLGSMICRISPSAPAWKVDGYDWNHPCFAAKACAGSDVIAYAKRQGWGVRS